MRKNSKTCITISNNISSLPIATCRNSEHRINSGLPKIINRKATGKPIIKCLMESIYSLPIACVTPTSKRITQPSSTLSIPTQHISTWLPKWSKMRDLIWKLLRSSTCSSLKKIRNCQCLLCMLSLDCSWRLRNLWCRETKEGNNNRLRIKWREKNSYCLCSKVDIFWFSDKKRSQWAKTFGCKIAPELKIVIVSTKLDRPFVFQVWHIKAYFLVGSKIKTEMRHPITWNWLLIEKTKGHK